ncbi:ubiquinone anaerobic biosynthesis protein UbiU [Undibacter mobilis]|uniref:Ubiquinone biosynthesis protein UbiU n=1 Tax=Undibacter mobilis TaxID=2292256 RepID=A0A371BC71_9BRAD|nr:peptidase U32 family protein [Undibacter mobilis]RDV04951.1 U32 family peptidase [Undibacter mobilis]
MTETIGYQRPELVCPAGTPAGLRTAVDAGADAVYCGLQNETNARNFPGLNFTPVELEQSLAYAHARGAKVLLAVNTFPPAGRFDLWRDAIDLAARLGVDAVIVADIGVADYAAQAHPALRLHLSVQAGASSPEAIRFYCQEFGVKRVVLPRMLTVAEIAALHREIPCEIEAFIFGNIGMMAEGRCSLTNYVTGVSTNMDGVCSPAADVRYEQDARHTLTTKLGPVVIDRFIRGESAGYPTICKGRYLCSAKKDPYYAFEEPVSLNLSALLPDLMRAGVTALKIEGRQRSRAYVKDVVCAFRKAVDDLMAGGDAAFASLLALTEGRRETEGTFRTKRWR